VTRTMTFKNTVYVWVEDLEMPLSVDYVPDWTLQKAVEETLQNAYDEAFLSGGKAFVTDERSGTYVRDTGRGCDWQQIILIGDSGKRGENGATGKHGEGEIISFLVAARRGITTGSFAAMSMVSKSCFWSDGARGTEENGRAPVGTIRRVTPVSIRTLTRSRISMQHSGMVSSALQTTPLVLKHHKRSSLAQDRA